MQPCHLKRFGRKRRGIRRCHILFLITTIQNEDFVGTLKSLFKSGYKISVIFYNKLYKPSTKKFKRFVPTPINHPLPEWITEHPDLYSALEDIFSLHIDPPVTIVIDNELLLNDLKKFGNTYTTHLFSNVFPVLRGERHESIRPTKSEVDFTQIYVNYNEYPRKTENIYTFLHKMPSFYIMFCALGYFRESYNFRMLLKCFYRFLEREEKHFGGTVILAIGGNFNEKNYVDDEYYTFFKQTVDSGKYASNILMMKQMTKERKKAILRMSYAMLYLNVAPQYNPDITLALSVGTPIISINTGYGKQIIKDEPGTGFLVNFNVEEIVDAMYSITYPTTYEKKSYYSRLNYMKYHTRLKCELASFDSDDLLEVFKGPPMRVMRGRRYNNDHVYRPK